MVGRKFFKYEAGSGDASTARAAGAAAAAAVAGRGAENFTNSSVKFRVVNANLKTAINNCRNLLQNEIRAANIMMREKIQQWLLIDETQISFNVVHNKGVPLAQENESMRQILSNLVHGPLGSLLPQENRTKLVKLVIPTLPKTAHNLLSYEDLKEVDFFRGYESQTSLHNDGRCNQTGTLRYSAKTAKAKRQP